MKYSVRLDVNPDAGFEYIPFDNFEDALMEFIYQVDTERKNIAKDTDDKCPEGLIVELVYGDDNNTLMAADFRYGTGKITHFN